MIRHAGAAPGFSASGKPSVIFRPVIAGCEKILMGLQELEGAECETPYWRDVRISRVFNVLTQ